MSPASCRILPIRRATAAVSVPSAGTTAADAGQRAGDVAATVPGLAFDQAYARRTGRRAGSTVDGRHHVAGAPVRDQRRPVLLEQDVATCGSASSIALAIAESQVTCTGEPPHGDAQQSPPLGGRAADRSPARADLAAALTRNQPGRPDSGISIGAQSAEQSRAAAAVGRGACPVVDRVSRASTRGR